MMNEDATAKFLSQHQMVSVMNNTKWKKFIAAITADPAFEPAVIIKYLFDKENDNSFSPVWWDEVERIGFKAIEWVKVNPINEENIGRLVKNKTKDYTQFIKAGLDKNSIPYEHEDGIFQINGYLKI